VDLFVNPLLNSKNALLYTFCHQHMNVLPHYGCGLSVLSLNNRWQQLHISNISAFCLYLNPHSSFLVVRSEVGNEELQMIMELFVKQM
jgi:hypothetical protein